MNERSTKVLSRLNPKGYFGPELNQIYYSYYLASTIIVVRYFNDEHWYFKKYDLIQGAPYGCEMRANTPLSFFKEDKKNHPNFNRRKEAATDRAVPPPFRRNR